MSKKSALQNPFEFTPELTKSEAKTLAKSVIQQLPGKGWIMDLHDSGEGFLIALRHPLGFALTVVDKGYICTWGNMSDQCMEIEKTPIEAVNTAIRLADSYLTSNVVALKATRVAFNL